MLLLRNTDSKAPENHSRKSVGKLVDGSKSFPGKQTADPGLIFPFRMDGWVIKIIGFELLTKGRDIPSASNVVRNRIKFTNYMLIIMNGFMYNL